MEGPSSGRLVSLALRDDGAEVRVSNFSGQLERQFQISLPDLPLDSATILGEDGYEDVWILFHVYKQGWKGTESLLAVAVSPEGKKAGELRLPLEQYASEDVFLDPIFPFTIYEMHGTKEGLTVNHYSQLIEPVTSTTGGPTNGSPIAVAKHTGLRCLLPKPHLLMAPIAERLVLGSAAPAQRAMLLGNAFAEWRILHLDPPLQAIRAVLRDDHARRPFRVGLLFSGDRVAERPGRAPLDDRDDLLHGCRVRVDPGTAVVVKDLRQPSYAVLHVRANPVVVMDGDPLAHVVHPVVETTVTCVAGIEAYGAVGAVAGRLVRGGTTTTQRDDGAGSTRRLLP